MTKYTAEDILTTWEQSWGTLPDKWKNEFLNHHTIAKIIYYPDYWINRAISRNKKLDEVLDYLIKNEKKNGTRDYFPEIKETDEMINKIIKSFSNNPSSPIPDNDWWRDQA